MRKLVLPVVAGAVLFSGTAAAHPAADFVKRLEQARSAGQIDLDRYFLERFYYIFAPGNVDPRFAVEFAPVKDGTGLIAEFLQARSKLRPATVSRIEGLLAPNLAAETYDTEHFRLSFSRTGGSAVPAADVDANGIPDFVEDVGEYAEYSLWAEVTEMGFTMPALDARNGDRMLITFQEMNAYGTTSCPGGICSINMENDFAGFPENDDPDGDAAGAAKVTFAHELKHAIQYAASGWSEGGWVELDATWMEDEAYPDTNDYANYINSTRSQIVTPTDSLDKGGTGSYYDAIWETSMSERFGIEILVDLWGHRGSHRSENMLVSYDTILQQYGSSLAQHFGQDYMVRNYLTAGRSVNAGPIYPDAAKFDEGPVTTSQLPVSASRSLNHLAGEFIEVPSTGASSNPKISLNAGLRSSFGLVAVLWRKDGSSRTVPVTVTRGKASVTLDEPWSGLSRLGLVVSNTATGGRAVSYTLTVN